MINNSQFIFAFIIFLKNIVLYVLVAILALDWLKGLPIILPIVLIVAFFTVFERKILAGIQRRRGPNVVGLYGLLQAFADAFKLLSKETIIPSLANNLLFIFAPIFIFLMSMLSWGILPINFKYVIADIDIGLLFLFANSSFGVYGLILSGWASNSKYAFLGSLRSAAQLISYEISMLIIIMPVLAATSSLNMTHIVLCQKYLFYWLPFFPCFFFFICALAETNRIPFDLPEAESELVSGYNVEYSAIGFVFFFLAEYANITLMSSIIIILFLGGWTPWLSISFFKFIPFWFWFPYKLVLIMYIFIWIRGSLPRYRYDQLMILGWKVILPTTLAVLIFYLNLIFAWGGFHKMRGWFKFDGKFWQWQDRVIAWWFAVKTFMGAYKHNRKK